MAEILNNFFQSTFTDEDLEFITDFPQWTLEQLPEISLTKQSILNKLAKLDIAKASGPDGMHPCVLKNCAESLVNPLYYLFQQSLNSGELPLEWKQANVTPIFKKGSRSQASNYRPVSLTSQVVKILESIVKDSINEFVANNQMLTPHQHGFCKGKYFLQIC